MAPTISELARVKTEAHHEEHNKHNKSSATGRTKKTRKHAFKSRPGHDQMFQSVVKNLEDAFLNDTAMTAAELWARADMSGIPEKDRPNYTAFCTYLRHKVTQGRLLCRKETQEERKVRRGTDTAPFNRFANLYALPDVADSVPTVTKTYDEIAPLDKKQEEFVHEHPAVRTRKEHEEAEAEKPTLTIAPAPDPEEEPGTETEQPAEEEETPKEAAESASGPVPNVRIRVRSRDDEVAVLRKQIDALKTTVKHLSEALSSYADAM